MERCSSSSAACQFQNAPEPDYFEQYASVAPGAVRFDQPRDRLIFDRAYLDLPLLTADPGAARAMREQCERQLQALSQASTLAARVLAGLFAADGSVYSARQLARQLGMSERTLKRRLAEQNTSYTELLDAARRTRALELLGAGLSVEEISARLGYSDAANFTRAFRRWTGQSPRVARREARAARS
jgi:AraC-like DNA-binding protein